MVVYDTATTSPRWTSPQARDGRRDIEGDHVSLLAPDGDRAGSRIDILHRSFESDLFANHLLRLRSCSGGHQNERQEPQQQRRFHAKMRGGLGLESWYNGKTLTIAAHPEKVFAQAQMPETIDRTLDVLAERYDMAVPMGDLFYGSAEKALLSDTTRGGYAGTAQVGDTPCVHLSFQDVGVDWELWLPRSGDTLPKRFKAMQKSRSGQPAVDVTFTSWDLGPSLADSTFVPKVPAAYEGIAVLQRAAAVKKNPPPVDSTRDHGGLDRSLKLTGKKRRSALFGELPFQLPVCASEQPKS